MNTIQSTAAATDVAEFLTDLDGVHRGHPRFPGQLQQVVIPKAGPASGAPG